MLTRWKNTIGCNCCNQSWHVFGPAFKDALANGTLSTQACPGHPDGTPCAPAKTADNAKA